MNTRAASLLACLLLVPSVPLPAGEEKEEVRWLAVKDLRVDQVNPTLLMICSAISISISSREPIIVTGFD